LLIVWGPDLLLNYNLLCVCARASVCL